MGLNFQVHQRASEFNESYDIFLDLYGDVGWKPFETDFRPMCVRCNYVRSVSSLVITPNLFLNPKPKPYILESTKNYFAISLKQQALTLKV